MSAHWSDALTRMSACGDAVEWAMTQPSYAVAWRRCQRPDWLLWLAHRCCRTLTQRRAIVVAACDCAETALRAVPAGEARPAEAIRVTRAWCRRGRATITEVRAAAAAAAAAADDAYAAYGSAPAPGAAAAADAYAAAWAAANAGWAAANAAYAANAAAAAADAANAANAAAADAAYAYGAAHAANAREASRRTCCRLIRARIPRPTLSKEATR